MNMPENVDKLLRLALHEDIGKGDITTLAIYRPGKTTRGQFIAKESGIIAGIKLAKLIFTYLDQNVKIESYYNDGDFVRKGEIIAMINGPANTLLTGERTVLNFMQRMSGIATKTRRFVDAVTHTACGILDTRKTAPGNRFLDKLAVSLGGGKNHRFGLDDMFLIKENHILAAGGISRAIDACYRYADENNIKADIEIEVKNLKEVDQVLKHGQVRYILLDNMQVKMLKEAVFKVGNSFLTEASGNVTLENVSTIAETGVDFISVGSLTHSVNALDISLLLFD